MFLVAADLLYRKVSLEHAAAAEVNLNQAALLLILLLTIPLLAILAPAVDIAGSIRQRSSCSSPMAPASG